MRIAWTALLLAAATLMTAAAFAASAGASTARTKSPPCTRKAIRAGLKRGSAQPKNARLQSSFGCAGGWAYAGIQVGGKHGFDAVAVLRAKRGVWVAVNRARPCRRHEIPKKIYRPACTTS